MVVRDDNGNILDINATSTTQLYEQHVQATDRIRRATVSLNIYFIEFMRLIEISFIYTFCPLYFSHNLNFILFTRFSSLISTKIAHPKHLTNSRTIY